MPIRRPSALALAPLALAATLALGDPAAAHTPFLAPASFAPQRDWVTVTGGMHEETALVADFALRPGDLFETAPDGRTQKLDGVVQLKGLTAADAPLPTPGTYRLSTGLRLAREMTFAQVDGAWRPVRGPRPAGAGPGGPGGGEGRGRRPAGGPERREAGEGPPPLDAAPAGAPTVKSGAWLRADTYVTRGAPSDGALKPTGEGLEFAPAANPNAIFLDHAFAVRLLLDGQPVAGAPVLVRRADEAYADRKTEFTAVTDARGVASVRFPLSGAYVLEAKTPAAAPGARPPEKSYLVSLTVEATP